jgi:hypothetical protein
MRFWAGLGFSTGLAGVALLSACSTKELLAPTPAVFTAPQNRLAVDGAWRSPPARKPLFSSMATTIRSRTQPLRREASAAYSGRISFASC